MLQLFLVLFLAAPSSAREIDRTAVLVNGDVVLRSDINAFRKNFALRRQIDPFIQVLSFAGDAKDGEALDYMIQERLVIQKYPPTEEEIEEEGGG